MASHKRQPDPMEEYARQYVAAQRQLQVMADTWDPRRVDPQLQQFRLNQAITKLKAVLKAVPPPPPKITAANFSAEQYLRDMMRASRGAAWTQVTTGNTLRVTAAATAPWGTYTTGMTTST